MKKLTAFISFLVVCLALQSTAQNCTPDSNIPDDAFGVYPLPYDENESPDGGITDSACLNHRFEFVFTAIAGDSFTFGTTRLPLDSLSMPKTGGISGLPKGISYACDPPNCTFPKQSKGCVILKGTVKDASEVGNHTLKLSGTLYANGSPSGLKLSFPSPLIAPGTYTLTVLDDNAGKCQKLDVPTMTDVSINTYPNPSNGLVRVEMPSEFTNTNVTVYSNTGSLVSAKNMVEANTFDIHISKPGLYLVNLENEGKLYQKKVVIE